MPKGKNVSKQLKNRINILPQKAKANVIKFLKKLVCKRFTFCKKQCIIYPRGKGAGQYIL